jgi:hypothetical protein
MPRCKHCPIVDECNKDPIIVNSPDKSGKPVQRRLCPLTILLARMNPKAEE